MPLTRRAALALAGATLLRAADGFPRLLERFVEPTGARLGFALHHLESGERISVRGDERFPMASVYKLPIAVEVLARVDGGTLALDRTVRLTPADLRLGLGNDEVADLVGETGHDFTVGELLERTLVDSDNASSDALLGLVGAEAVTRRMAALGCDGIRVDRPEVELLLDFIGASTASPVGGWTLDRLRERYRSADEPQRRRALISFMEDPRDTATPDAMVNLLTAVKSNARLVGRMKRCTTGRRRLRAQLPADMEVADRTGTSDTTAGITAATNNVAIFYLPNGAGTVAVAAFLKMATGGREACETALARIGRAVFERYVGA